MALSKLQHLVQHYFSIEGEFDLFAQLKLILLTPFYYSFKILLYQDTLIIWLIINIRATDSRQNHCVL